MLEVDSRTVDGSVVLAVRGDIEVATKRTMHGALAKAIDLAERSVIVDLGDVSFLDSTGLALMLNASRRLTRRRLGFAVACPDRVVRRAFDIAGLDECFPITAGVDDALAAARPAVSG